MDDELPKSMSHTTLVHTAKLCEVNELSVTCLQST